ncbi:MAG TPA: hypothetical protein VLT16_17760 [Candidatus Limnocylindrales bacterium]|nr:hypothetical protein [Candidatus Limnocylindrales bacterium]
MKLKRSRANHQRGTALLLALFALLLLSAIGALLYLSAGTETRIAANYSNGLDAYYAARFGLEEVRDRIKYTSVPNPPAGGLADLLPKDIAGNSGGVLYVLNPAPGEVVDPTDAANRYFDDQLCHDYNSGVPKGSKCSMVPGLANWSLPPQTSMAAPGTASAYKWVRVNMKTNRVSDPYFVDPTNVPSSLDTRVCWDGQSEQLSPSASNPACDANGMRTVYMLTALAVTPGIRDNSARKMLRSEIVAPSIRPPGAITMDAASASPVLGTGIPTTAIDGRPHNIDGTLSTHAQCSSVAALATDNASATSQLAQALNNLRLSIVQTANNSCNWDGTNLGSNICTPALWWVRGTDSATRYVTSTTTTTTTSGTSGKDGDHSGTSTSTTTTPCDGTNPSCYLYLNLGSPELYAVSASLAPHVPSVTLPGNPSAPFAGTGNQTDTSIYQSAPARTLPNEIAAVSALVAASASQSNYHLVSAASLATTYGSVGNPAIVVITDTSLVLQSTTLTGYGILVVPNDLEITNSTFQWTGIVLVQSGNGQFLVGSGANGFINGALLLQPGANTAANLRSNTSTSSAFRISYSCDAIDMAFGSLPFKVVASSEFSF